MVRIGTSGFSYDDWKGRFYPSRLAKKDMLGYYARVFDTTEVNSSYYAIPGAASFAGMAKKTPDNFEFVVKAHKDMTHVDKPDRELFEIFLGSVQPLKEAGKFGCVLAQYPNGCHYSEENKDKIRQFRDWIGDTSTVIEFRNADWVNEDTFALLKELNFGFCSVDEPRLNTLMPSVVEATSNIGYVRFHGRNAANWFKHEESYQRYDYLYNEEELRGWVPKVTDLESMTAKTYVFFNNHYQGKSAQNARMFASMLGMDLPLLETVEPGGQMSLGEF